MAAVELSCRVVSNRALTPSVFEIAFAPVPPIEFEAGQFISIRVPGDRPLRRAYSIASPPEARPVELCVKLVDPGPGSRHLHGLRAGELFQASGPHGGFRYEPREGRRAAFIATGTGIAPFRSMIRSRAFAARRPVAALCLFGVREEPELLYGEEMASDPAIAWVPALSRPSAAWKGFRGRVTDYLRGLGQGHPWLETEYYLCGGKGMIDEVRSILAERGVAPGAIHEEAFYTEPGRSVTTPS